MVTGNSFPGTLSSRMAEERISCIEEEEAYQKLLMKKLYQQLREQAHPPGV